MVVKSTAKVNINTKVIIHLPDLHFVQFCEERFGLNRGVYNTIDSWFYHKGVTDIINRRKSILHFLGNIRQSIQNGRLKFGHGGLSMCLSTYWDKYKEGSKVKDVCNILKPQGGVNDQSAKIKDNTPLKSKGNELGVNLNQTISGKPSS